MGNSHLWGSLQAFPIWTAITTPVLPEQLSGTLQATTTWHNFSWHRLINVHWHRKRCRLSWPPWPKRLFLGNWLSIMRFSSGFEKSERTRACQGPAVSQPLVGHSKALSPAFLSSSYALVQTIMKRHLPQRWFHVLLSSANLVGRTPSHPTWHLAQARISCLCPSFGRWHQNCSLQGLARPRKKRSKGHSEESRGGRQPQARIAITGCDGNLLIQVLLLVTGWLPLRFRMDFVTHFVSIPRGYIKASEKREPPVDQLTCCPQLHPNVHVPTSLWSSGPRNFR